MRLVSELKPYWLQVKTYTDNQHINLRVSFQLLVVPSSELRTHLDSNLYYKLIDNQLLASLEEEK